MPFGQHRTQHGDRTRHGTGLRDRLAGRAGAGNNHGGARGAIAALFLLLALALAPFSGALAQGNPRVQSNVPAEATAENAVVARDRALVSGQRIAYGRMASELGLPTNLSDQQIEALVASLVIESERVTQRGYSARITVNFRDPGQGGQSAEASHATPEGPAVQGGPAVTSVEATALYRSFPEYLEIKRRLGAAPAVARVEVLGIAGDMARLRLALRSVPPQAAADLAAAGLQVAPVQPVPGQATPGSEGWRLGLAGGR
ncbi:hypothetical protein DFH01_17990 [Falsiroseomonas bella]|uniref:Uncharacterized protein n=1 Tax=Falsiroseomonas bella TaxID=2184016 RepID=A0A317FBW0_9PROT|nr:hypothetical protein [Falsiroseomonas bella]PWS35497.1 hypothetical protein DFH01_17990 [Falsiroseomonas bella]